MFIKNPLFGNFLYDYKTFEWEYMSDCRIENVLHIWPSKNVMKWLECHLIFISWNIVSFSWAWMPSHYWVGISSHIHEHECHLIFMGMNVISYSWAWMSSHLHRLECHLIFIDWKVISYSWDWMSSHIQIGMSSHFIDWNVISYSWVRMVSHINGLGLWCLISLWTIFQFYLTFCTFSFEF